jgi:DNA-binding SARP family transcriptional activator
MLGNFSLTIQETALNLPSSRSLSLLKYLLLNHKQNTPREMLIDIFWPEVSMERGRNNLNVAMNGIRNALRTVTDAPVIFYKESAYGITPDVQFWLDVEEFDRLVASGRRRESKDKLKASVADYESALSLYQGDFLEENPYEGWAILPRERLRLAYLDTLDRLNQINFNQENYAMCIALSQHILTRDRCREDAHCLLMRCYSRQGQDHLALRQYQACVEALRLELDVTPAPKTNKLYEQIRQHKSV